MGAEYSGDRAAVGGGGQASSVPLSWEHMRVAYEIVFPEEGAPTMVFRVAVGGRQHCGEDGHPHPFLRRN